MLFIPPPLIAEPFIIDIDPGRDPMPASDVVPAADMDPTDPIVAIRLWFLGSAIITLTRYPATDPEACTASIAAYALEDASYFANTMPLDAIKSVLQYCSPGNSAILDSICDPIAFLGTTMNSRDRGGTLSGSSDCVTAGPISCEKLRCVLEYDCEPGLLRALGLSASITLRRGPAPLFSVTSCRFSTASAAAEARLYLTYATPTVDGSERGE